LEIHDVAPDRACYRPGETAHITVTIEHTGPAPTRSVLSLALTHLATTISEQEVEVALATGLTTADISLMLPVAAPRGYGLDVTLFDASGHPIAEGSGALDVLERWSQAPRYGFVADFSPGMEAGEISARAHALCRYHLNVVQFYDWMWRHYRLLPPTEEFTDALGRALSLATVRARIASAQARGAAALAYGAVYGAEPEFADAHPELALFDEGGERISLDRLFYIMDISPDSPWVPLIVGEFARAVRELGFDGIHLDQYGFPKTARRADGTRIDLSMLFPSLIERAREAVAAARPGAGVIFNAVGNWPVETVAPTSQEAVYIEVWPPDETYADWVRLVHDAKRLGGGKPVILAAYLSPFASQDASTVPGAEAAALLATATIAVAGGSHLLLGERDGVLCDPYYPRYATMRPGFAKRMRAYYDVLVRYEEWLIGRDVTPDPSIGVEVAGLACSPSPAPGVIWTVATARPGFRTVHLINLNDQESIAWNALHNPPNPRHDLTLCLTGLPPVRRAWLVSPDAALGRPVPVTPVQRDGHWFVHIPTLHVWSLLLCEVDDEAPPS
jgi:dextranase